MDKLSINDLRNIAKALRTDMTLNGDGLAALAKVDKELSNRLARRAATLDAIG